MTVSVDTLNGKFDELRVVLVAVGRQLDDGVEGDIHVRELIWNNHNYSSINSVLDEHKQIAQTYLINTNLIKLHFL